MRKSLAGLLMVVAFGIGSLPASAQDHLVTTEAASARLAAAATLRQERLALLDRSLSSAEARSAASALGTDLGRVRATLPTLSDGELEDLSQRAAALESDPVAGLDDDIRTLLIIFLIVAIVLLVFKAVD